MSSQPAAETKWRSHEHLTLANTIRLKRAAARRHVRSYRTTTAARYALADELDGRPRHLDGLRVDDALTWVARWPLEDRVLVLRHVGCSSMRRVGDLTDRQHEALLHTLRSPANANTGGFRSAPNQGALDAPITTDRKEGSR